MDNRFISLLYPNQQSYEFHSIYTNLPSISEEVCDELGLTEIFNLKSASLTEFFTTDTEVIKYRQSAISDLLAFPQLLDTLSSVHPILDDIRELRRLDDEGKSSADSYLYSIAEIELYVSCIDTLERGFEGLYDKVRSEAFRQRVGFIDTICKSEYYVELNNRLKALSDRVHEVKSVTIGVNLDAQFRPESAGVVSVNSEKFKSGKILDKILRLSFKNDAYTCIAKLAPMCAGQSDNKQEALIGAFNSALDEVFSSSVKG
jgi:hypothetical protein